MDHELETDLSDAFSRHVSQLPSEAVERICRIDYQPQTRRLSPRVRIGALAGAASTATVVSVVLLSGAAPAFAGWTASPTKPSNAERADANSSCQAQLASLPGAPPGASWSAVVTDVRGPYSLIVFEDVTGIYATCLTGPSLTDVSENATAGSGSRSMVAGDGNSGGYESSRAGSFVFPGSAGIEGMSVANIGTSSSSPYSVTEGQVASDVSGVTLVMNDGSQVQTTTAGGWFLAWWPGSTDPASAEITTPSGTTTQSLSRP